MKAPLQEKFEKAIAPELQKELGTVNVNAIPKLEKVSVNVGVGSFYTGGTKDLSFVEENISAITGQKPSLRRARLSISNFKLREGMPTGYAVTLRGRYMYDFVQKLVSIALPRVRDFRGISVKGFDGQGNFSLGIKDVTIFPAIDPENVVKPHGLQINIQTSATNDYEAYRLLKAIGFPFKDEVTKPE